MIRDKTDRRSFLCRLIQCAAFGGAGLHNKKLFSQEKKERILATVKISGNQNLEKIGGFVLLEETPVGELLIIRTSETEYTSLSNVCPHKQCHVRVMNPTLIRCPCHHSRYKIDGTYISGPSKASLKKFVTHVEGDIITTLEN
jgi:Rieske Fe-S protein